MTDRGISASEDGPPTVPESELPSMVVVVRSTVHGRPVAVPAEVVERAERPYAAYQLRVGGMSWEEVALEMGYPDGRAARTDVTRYLDEGRALVEDLTRQELLKLELLRLDKLQAAVWPEAMKGHLPSVNAARSLIMDRAKLMGLDVMAAAGDDTMADQRTVIVPSDSNGYTKVLMEASGA